MLVVDLVADAVAVEHACLTAGAYLQLCFLVLVCERFGHAGGHRVERKFAMVNLVATITGTALT